MIKEIQAQLVKQELDGWLLADFQGRNNIAAAFLNFPSHLTRRFFYMIPAVGEPTILAHNIEKQKFGHLEGKLIPFTAYVLLEKLLAELLKGKKRIAMEYSPKGRLPYIGLVDAGTIELVREFGVEIVPSSDLVAKFLATLSEKQVASQRESSKLVVDTVQAAFDLIAERLKEKQTITEWDVVSFIMDRFDKNGFDWEHQPNCSVGSNAGNPHYEPTSETAKEIKMGDLILIDLWAKKRSEHGTFADITQMAFAGSKDRIDSKYVEQFAVLIKARDAAIEFVREHIGKRELCGAEVDDVCRGVIAQANLAEAFTHRTGHSIHASVHGPGPNIDNLETEDSRLLQPGHLFSIEPGLYYKDFGMRTEINALITNDGVVVTTLPMQTEIRPLF